MNTVYIKKANIKPLLKEAVGDWHVYAPLEETGGDVNFSLLDRDKIDEALDKVTLEDKATAIGPKDLFFPQLESLFEIKKGKSNLRQIQNDLDKLVNAVLDGTLKKETVAKKESELLKRKKLVEKDVAQKQAGASPASPCKNLCR